MATDSIENKEQIAQERFNSIVNGMGLTGLQTIHYESEIGILRIGIGRDVNGIVNGVFWWGFPEVDQDGKTFQYGNTYKGNAGDTVEQAHDEIRSFAEWFAKEMLSGRVVKQ